METLKEILFAIHSWCSNHWLITYIVGGIIAYFAFEKLDYLQKEDEEVHKYFNIALWPMSLSLLLCLRTVFECVLWIGFLFSVLAEKIKLLRKPRKEDKDDDYYCHI